MEQPAEFGSRPSPCRIEGHFHRRRAPLADRRRKRLTIRQAAGHRAVRFLAPDGTPLAPRLYGDWTTTALAERLVAALGPEAPPWLALVGDDPAPQTDAAVRGTPWARVPMTAAQRARVAADLDGGADPSRWLSPAQLRLARGS